MTDVNATPSRELLDVLRDDGSLAARGFIVDGKQVGYWEWFRRDGSVQRSGYFEAGQPVSLWSDHDADSRVIRSMPAERYPNADLLQLGNVVFSN